MVRVFMRLLNYTPVIPASAYLRPPLCSPVYL